MIVTSAPPAVAMLNPRRLVKRLRPTARADIADAVRAAASRAFSRRLLNLAYNALPWEGKRFFHAEYGGLFKGGRPLARGRWLVRFAGRRVAFPLTPERAWLDWDLAVSAAGQDVEVKRTYETLLGAGRVKVFFDIGANYCGHSVLLVTHGVRVVSFEPNPECLPYVRELYALNGLAPDVRPVALADSVGEAYLSFPADQTWRGTIEAAATAELDGLGEVKRLRVPLATIDSYTEAGEEPPDLIKIDAEGAELAILRGGEKTLRARRPTIIFESWPGEKRGELFHFFSAAGYRVTALPLLPGAEPRLLDADEFDASAATNFAALPAGRVAPAARGG